MADGITRVASKVAMMNGFNDACRSRDLQASVKLLCIFRGGPRRRPPGFRHGGTPHSSTRAALNVAFSHSPGATSKPGEWRGAGGVDGRRQRRRVPASDLRKSDTFSQISATPGWTHSRTVQLLVTPGLSVASCSFLAYRFGLRTTFTHSLTSPDQS